MDQSTYTNLTGQEVTDVERFKELSAATKSQIEEALGWPLCPEDWGNQYLEIGKTRDDSSCSDVDTSDLDEPDDVIGSYRIFDWEPLNIYLAIDPATKIHAVKLVRGDVTHRTLDPSDYRMQLVNARTEPYAKYIEIDRRCVSLSGCGCGSDRLQVAIDADWAFDSLPYALKRLWADGIYFGLDSSAVGRSKGNVKSESIGSHSYTKFDNGDPVRGTEGSRTLAKYAGPYGTSFVTLRSV